MHENYVTVGISAMGSDVSKGILRGRPKGGVATLLHCSYPTANYVDCSKRSNIIIVGGLALVNVYLPSCHNEVERDEVARILDEIILVLQGQCYKSLIFAGDINCDLRNNTPTSLLIKARLKTLGLVLVNDYLEPNNIDISFTFYQESTGANSYIDHFLVSQLCNVRRICAIDDARNVSDHLPVVMTFESDTLFQNPVESSVTVPPGVINCQTKQQSRLLWDQSDLSLYYESTRLRLSSFTDLIRDWSLSVGPDTEPTEYTRRIKVLYDEMVNGLHSAAGETIKTVHSRPGVRKYWWNSDINDAKSAAIRTHNDWVTAGKPRQGEIFSERNEANVNIEPILLD